MKPSKPRSAARHLIWPSAAILLGMSFVPLCMLVFFSFADGNVSTLNGVAGYTVRNIVEAVTSLTVQGLMLKSFWMALLRNGHLHCNRLSCGMGHCQDRS